MAFARERRLPATLKTRKIRIVEGAEVLMGLDYEPRVHDFWRDGTTRRAVRVGIGPWVLRLKLKKRLPEGIRSLRIRRQGRRFYVLATVERSSDAGQGTETRELGESRDSFRVSSPGWSSQTQSSSPALSRGALSPGTSPEFG